MRPFAFAVAVLIATTCGAYAEPAALVGLAKAVSSTLHPEVVGYGTVAPDSDYLTTVAIPREGIVTAVSVRAGQLVRVGDPIATIETAPAAAANYQQAKSQLAFAGKDLAHTKALYDEQLATKSQLASAQKAYADAQAQLQAQTKIGAGQASEILRATAAGIVTAFSVSPGDRLQANAPIASIATRDRLLLNLGLEPEETLRVPVGAKVVLRSPQTDRIHFSGQVDSINATVDPKSRLVNAVVKIPQNVARELILGMVLEGTVQLPGVTGIAVPRSALMTDKGGTYVFVVTNSVARRHNVKVRLETDQGALISDGVHTGDQVVDSGNAGLDDGTRIRVH